MATTIGIDLGGTKVLAAAVDESGQTSRHVKVATPVDGAEAIVEVIAGMVEQIDPSPAAVGVGAPGPVSAGVLLAAPNLHGFERPVPLGNLLAERLGMPVPIGNDASVGTLGEARHGAASGSDNVLGCFLGTGIGGGLVLGGRLHVGVSGTAGELGHVPVEMGEDAAMCGCGRRGCVEAYAGRAAMAQDVQRAIAEGEDTRLRAIMDEKGKDRLTSGVWKAALADGDPLATRLVDRSVRALGAAIGGVLNVVDVDTVVFGGGLAEKLGQDHVDRIAAAVKPRLMAPDVPRRWLLATLGDDAGVVGAAELARA